MEFEPMLTPREKSPLPENVPRGVSNPRHFGSEPKHYQLSYSGPQMSSMNEGACATGMHMFLLRSPARAQGSLHIREFFLHVTI